ncbi:sensor histidine kinase [Pontiellaceae bacterium B12219]|nr:sensor histidine kinase [Pontiellaceae bacterium B12219]
MTIFINYKVFDYDSNYIGATGVGLEVGALRNLMKQYGEKYQRNVYLTDRKGRIVLSSNSAYADIADIEGMNAIADQVISGDGGAFDYRADGQRVFLNSRFVKELDWYLLVAEREGAATKLLSRGLFLNLIICGLITLGVVGVTAVTITLYERASKEQEETITNQHEQLKLKNEQLAEAAQKKNLLLHILCHDLANPFGALISSLNLLEDDPDLLADLLPEIKKSLSNGMGTIELVREMRALEEGKIDLPLRSVLLEPLIQESLTMLRSTLEAKGIEIKLRVARELSVLVEHVSFTNSVLNNLLTNAVKFSEKGAEVRIHAEKNSSGQVELTIADDGIGMPDSILSALFNLKGNVNRAGTNGELGTGFGMPLVEQIVKMYGGRIKVNSRDVSEFPQGHGTDVVLILNP